MILDEKQRIVGLNNHILKTYGIVLDKDAAILDFGCGSGRHTYEYLDAGYRSVIGFDIRDYVNLRDETDREHFCFSGADGSYRIPYPDDSFDLVASTSVFEHVIDQASAIAEIARVLKPSGAALHVFPSRWRPVEPHIFVPFGGAIQTRCWFSFWARMGVRNSFQRDMDVNEVVERNLTYSERGLCYNDLETIEEYWSNDFGSVEFAELSFLEWTRRYSDVSRFAFPLAKTLPGFLRLYRFLHTRVVLARKPNRRTLEKDQTATISSGPEAPSSSKTLRA